METSCVEVTSLVTEISVHVLRRGLLSMTLLTLVTVKGIGCWSNITAFRVFDTVGLAHFGYLGRVWLFPATVAVYT